MGRTLGVNQILKKTYPTIPISEEWMNVIGEPERNFRMLIWGPSGSGKTTFTMMLAKELANHGKVYYNSSEEGEGRTIQKVLERVNMGDVKPGKFMLGDRDNFQEMMVKIETKKPRFIIIDSMQYLYMTKAQYQKLIETFPKKAIILIPMKKKPKSIAYKEAVSILETSNIVRELTGLTCSEHNRMIYEYAEHRLKLKYRYTEKQITKKLAEPRFWASWVRQWGKLDLQFLDCISYHIDTGIWIGRLPGCTQSKLLQTTEDWQRFYERFHKMHWPEVVIF